MRIGYVPWHRPPEVHARACIRDGQVELTYAEAAHRVAEQFAAAGIGAGDVVAVSTGRPKGVRLDHANLVAMGASIGETMKLTGDDAPRPAARAMHT
ncbi:hypothetical protein ACWCXB_04935 [Streptomyces sp. NPDC001514]